MLILINPSPCHVNNVNKIYLQEIIEEESAFLQFMKRVERELNQAQTYLYNVTDNIIGTSLSKEPSEKPVSLSNSPPVINTNTRFAPIPLEVNSNSQAAAQNQVQDTL